MAVSGLIRGLNPSAGGAKRAENSYRHCPRIYNGRIYRRVYNPSYGTSGYVEAWRNSHFTGIYYFLLYLFTK